jgi:hypothetical protein
MFTNNIILTISIHGTLKTLDICFGPFVNSERDNKYHQQHSTNRHTNVSY